MTKKLRKVWLLKVCDKLYLLNKDQTLNIKKDLQKPELGKFWLL